MHTQIRIKASDDFADRFALVLAGGKFVDGKHPKFRFENEAQRIDYERIRKRLKEEENNASTQQSNPDVRKAQRKYRRTRQFGI
ncbi:hypothetical protein ACFSUM_18730 [Virgibacillus siamensis]|uniref:hypothetical protein n=1 Tax=Virgibacillus siamensis TaxID=480071 RepID=UPI00363055E4